VPLRRAESRIVRPSSRLTGRALRARPFYRLRLTVTVKDAVLVLPLVSVAEQVTRVRPTANGLRDLGEQVTGTGPSTSSCAVTV
jgi:hypothetical protein